jgi:hypothetical protein
MRCCVPTVLSGLGAVTMEGPLPSSTMHMDGASACKNSAQLESYMHLEGTPNCLNPAPMHILHMTTSS